MTWSNDKLPLLSNSLITEYDIAAGNVSVMEAFGLKPKEMTDYLRSLPKYERNVKVGLLQKEDKAFASALEESFTKAVQNFIHANHLDIDTDVTDIRRDAVYVVNRPIRYKNFVNGIIKFRPKSTYHAMIKIDPPIMIFYRLRSEMKEGDRHIEVDGLIRDNAKNFSEIMDLLTPGPLAFFEEFMEVVEAYPQNRAKWYDWIIEFSKFYKERKLDPEYYREFTKKATFKIFGDEGSQYESKIFENDMFPDLDISYNFDHIIRPLLQIIV